MVESRKIRVAIVGVGNCASALVQGVEFYQHVEDGDKVPGLMHSVLGGYHINDIEFVAAFDVDERKVGMYLAAAIFAKPNNTLKFCEPAHRGAVVVRGPVFDGIGKYSPIELSSVNVVDVVRVLRQAEVDVLINYLPVGSIEATHHYMKAALRAGCAVINCIPVFIVSDSTWALRFKAAKLPIIGDDIKSQVGATIVHRVLARLFMDRGIELDRSYQLNVGGNADFLNMLERERLQSKKVSKTEAVKSQLDHDIDIRDLHIGPSDHVPWLDDRKVAFIRLEGRGFGNTPLQAELRLEVWDSPNSAGVVIDAIRCAKLGLDRGIGGALEGPSAYMMKRPPIQHTDDEARQMVEEFIDAS